MIIPGKWTWNLFNGWLQINSWRVFLAVCAIPEFTACIAVSFFPESPRFLLSKKRTDEALEVFKKIYSINTGNHPDTYPVRLFNYYSIYLIKTKLDKLIEVVHICAKLLTVGK